MTLQIELGGGDKPIRNGFINLDLKPGADARCDLNDGIPFGDDEVDELYSAHCLEHLNELAFPIREICRVCKVGAKVRLVLPHWNHECAMHPGHNFVIGPLCAERMAEYPFYRHDGKYLSLKKVKFQPERWFHRAKQLYPRMTDEEIFRFVPDTAHEATFDFEVVQ